MAPAPQRVALVVTDRQIVPPTRGNRQRILGLVRGLRELGWRVALVSGPGPREADVRREADWHLVVRAPGFVGGPVTAFDPRPFRHGVERVAVALRPVVAVAEYAWLAPAIAGLPPNVLRVVDCHDVLHERTLRFRAAGLEPWVECTENQERALVAHADVLVAAQERDAAVLRALVPGATVRSLLPYIDAPRAPVEAHGSTVLAVGALHAGNEGIRRFADEVWPRVADACGGARLQIAGTVGEGMQSGPNVDWLGEVGDLRRWYADAAVVVCPVEVGTGVKIKLLEALRLGKAVVATPVAAEGLPPPSRPAWLEAPSVDGCGVAVRSLLAFPARRARLEREAYAYGEEHLSLPRFLDDLRSILATAATRPVDRSAAE